MDDKIRVKIWLNGPREMNGLEVRSCGEKQKKLLLVRFNALLFMQGCLLTFKLKEKWRGNRNTNLTTNMLEYEKDSKVKLRRVGSFVFLRRKM